ncbi:hypothetical protein [Deminuibacter soli]|nr:hypothetical protein [Deminuibacter soli]
MKQLFSAAALLLVAAITFTSCSSSGKSHCGCPSASGNHVNTKPLRDKDL